MLGTDLVSAFDARAQVTALDREDLDITDLDAISEGVYPSEFWTPDLCRPYRSAFRKLWNSINAKRGWGWDTNPFVWIVEFTVNK